MPELASLHTKTEGEANLTSNFYKKDGFLKKFLKSLPSSATSSSPPSTSLPPTPPDSATSSEDDLQQQNQQCLNIIQVDLIPAFESPQAAHAHSHTRASATSGSEVTETGGYGSVDIGGRSGRGGEEGVLIEGAAREKEEKRSAKKEIDSFRRSTSRCEAPPGTTAAAASGTKDTSDLAGLREARLSHLAQGATASSSEDASACNGLETSASSGTNNLCVMQQKVGAPTSCPQSENSVSIGPMVPMGTPSGPSSVPGGGAPRSVLKRSGQRSRGHRVSFNEEKNEIVESDYVILIHEEDEPQLVSVKAFDLGLNPGDAAPIDSVTLSPPEGYKDCFGRAVRETIVDDADPDPVVDINPDWKIEVHDPDCPRANLPDLVSSGRRSPQLTVENVRHHDQLMQDHHPEPEGGKVAKTGILKGGKLWKNGEKFRPVVHVDKVDEPRRSVRFSGRDEYTTLEAAAVLDKLPLDSSNEAKLACLLSPQFQELLLRENSQDGWHLELSPIGLDELECMLPETIENGEGIFRQPCPKHNKIEQHFEDEHISESVQRYDEMRRRIAVAEGRDNNSICSDESKSSSDSQSSDSTATETRIRRLENADVAQVAGGIIRSNSEVRRAIERNALRRSLIRFAEARKKDTNRNEKNEKQETSLIEKLKWLTASEDATNANSNGDQEENEEEKNQKQEEQEQGVKEERHHKEHRLPNTTDQYRKLATMFNRTTSLRPGDIAVPKDVREWKLNAELFADIEGEELPPGSITYTAIPVVSICEQLSDEECEKLIYSGGVRYTKEGTLPHHASSKSKPEVQIQEDVDEAIHDDRSSSVPSSSQSSPRLSGRSDADGASTAESGYSSNETNSDLSQILHPELDELVEFVKQDAGRIDRLRRRYDESEDHGFSRRPSVRGIRARFGSTSDILSQMANQLAPHSQMGNLLIPPPMMQPTAAGSHLSWPCREMSENETNIVLPRKKVSSTRSNPLPSLQEDAPFTSAQSNCTSLPPVQSMTISKNSRIGGSYSAGGDPDRESSLKGSSNRESSTSEHGRVSSHLPAQRAQSLSSLNQTMQILNQQTSCARHSGASLEYHHPSCSARRPASVHGHAPTDLLVSGPQHPTPHVHSTDSYSQPSQPRPFLYSSLEDSRQDDCLMMGSRGMYNQVSGSCHSAYPPQGVMPEAKHYVDHHNNFPQGCGSVMHSQVEMNPSLPRDFHGSNSSALASSSQPRASEGMSSYEESFCSGWHPHEHYHMHLDGHVLPPPIVSSHMSYTTPIVPDDKTTRPAALFNGLVSLDNDGPSISGRGSLEPYPIHSSPTRDSSLHLRHSQPMNVST